MDATETQIDSWHLFQNQQQYGPYRFSTLVDGVKKGHLHKEDLIWRPGWGAWRPAHSVSELFAPPEVDPPTKSNTPSVPNHEKCLATKMHQTAHELCAEKRHPVSQNYVVRHWRGDLSLPIFYWVNGIVANAACYILASMFASLVDGNKLGAGAPIALALTCFLIAVMLLFAWQMVGIWRSASNHAAQGKRFWAGVTKFMVFGCRKAYPLRHVHRHFLPQLETVGS
jgi:hypothetical protein